MATPKPNPEGLAAAITCLQCERSAALYIGDSSIDALTARAAGVKFIGVTTGPASREELLSLGALMVISDLGQLMAALEETAFVA